ncbi:MAG: hypothetical protein KHZ82_08505 [Peptoniphilus harei]|nr:hypothetical protein [Peptoniphilus harei]
MSNKDNYEGLGKMITSYIVFIFVLFWFILSAKFCNLFNVIVKISLLIYIIYSIKEIKSSIRTKLFVIWIVSVFVEIRFFSFIDIIYVTILSFLAFNLIYWTYKYLSISLYLLFYIFILAIILGLLNKETWQIIALSLVCVNLILSYDFLKYKYLKKNSKLESYDNFVRNEKEFKYNLIKVKIYLNVYILFAYLIILIINFLDKRCYVTRLTNLIFGKKNFIFLSYIKGSLFLILFALVILIINVIYKVNIDKIKVIREKIYKMYLNIMDLILENVFNTKEKINNNTHANE